MNNGKPTVLFFATDVALQSGASNALREIVRSVASYGAKPVVVIPDSRDSREMFPEKEFDVIYLPNIRRVRRTLNPNVQWKYMLAFLPTLIRLKRIIHDRQVDIVHFNEVTDIIGGMAARWRKIPSVCHVRADGIPNPYRSILLSILDRVVDTIVVPSRSVQRWIVKGREGIFPKIRIIRDHAFDNSQFDSSISGSAFREELGISPDVPLVTLVSKLQICKGHICFIKAAQIVLKSKIKAIFLVVGGVVDGHEREAETIKSAAHRISSSLEIRFVGTRSDLPAIYAASDIIVHCPIYHDAFPTVVLIGMLMGKPVIGSNIGGIPEQIEHGVTGLLIPPDDPIALSEAILRLIKNPEMAQSLGTEGMAWMKKNFTPDKQAQLLRDVYDFLMRS